MLLENKELLNVKGGKASGSYYAFLLGIGGLIILITGIINGYINPEKCN